MGSSNSERAVLALVVIAELLAAAFFTVSLVLDSATMASKYSFTPRSVTTYNAWGISAEVIVPVLQMPLMAYMYLAMEMRVMRVLPFLACAVSVGLLIAGNILSHQETTKRAALESDFAAKFNDFYCDTRTLRMCLQGKPADVLTVTRGNDSDVRASENVTEVGLAIWSRCNEVLLQSIALEAKLEDTEDDEIKNEGEIEVELNSFNTFINDCDNSRTVDAWCGRALHRTAPLSDTEQRALPSPFATNPKMYRKYTREWSKRMLFSNVLLGTAVGCLLAVGVLVFVSPPSRW